MGLALGAAVQPHQLGQQGQAGHFGSVAPPNEAGPVQLVERGIPDGEPVKLGQAYRCASFTYGAEFDFAFGDSCSISSVYLLPVFIFFALSSFMLVSSGFTNLCSVKRIAESLQG